MARIRTIKPEFFFDEELAMVSLTARLFFIGLWTQADSEGRLEERLGFLKAQIYPYEKHDIEAALKELTPKFIFRYEVDGKRYIQIRKFKEHQRITGKEAEKSSIFPQPPEEGNTGETPGKHPESQEGKGKEGKGREVVSATPPVSLFELWNKATQGTSLPLAREFNDERRRKCQVRLRERPLEQWGEIFSRMAKNPFLNGDNQRGWRASFDWIVGNSSNGLKVLEGKYDGALAVIRGPAQPRLPYAHELRKQQSQC